MLQPVTSILMGGREGGREGREGRELRWVESNKGHALLSMRYGALSVIWVRPILKFHTDFLYVQHKFLGVWELHLVESGLF